MKVTHSPLEAGVERWNRHISFRRGEANTIEVVDDFALKQLTQELMLTFMTPCQHELSEPGIVLLRLSDGPAVRIGYDHTILTASSERIAIHDERLRPVWGDHLYRILPP